jgi:hypothetical protein
MSSDQWSSVVISGHQRPSHLGGGELPLLLSLLVLETALLLGARPLTLHLCLLLSLQGSFRQNHPLLGGGDRGPASHAPGVGPWWDKVPNKFGDWTAAHYQEAGFRSVESLAKEPNLARIAQVDAIGLMKAFELLYEPLCLYCIQSDVPRSECQC